jgi:hypothetical protein
VQKTTRIHERYDAIVGFEAFNLFNHSNYGNFAVSATSAPTLASGARNPTGYGNPISVSSEGASLEYFGRNLQFFARFAF